MSLLLPPLVPIIRMLLLIIGLMASLCASIAQFLGFWQPVESDLTHPQVNGLGEDDLYTDEKK